MADPEAEPEVEVEPEPEIAPSLEPEIEPSFEPEIEPEVESEIELRALSEPEPEWDLAFKDWGPAWEIHVYIFASIFMVIALCSLMSMCYYIKDRRALKQGTLTFTLQCLLAYFTLLRSLVLFISPYRTADVINDDVTSMMWSFALPGLTAAFSVLLLVFLDTTKMTLGPPMFQRLSVLLVFTACHFVLVISSDIACAFDSDLCKPMQLFCQILFILYGSLLSVGYGYTAFSLYIKCATGVLSDAENSKIMRLVRISAFSSCIALAIATTHLYAASSDFGIYSDVMYVNAWDWWILQSILRLEETVSACLILVIAFRCPLTGINTIKLLGTRSKITQVRPITDSNYVTYHK